ncbi:MAG: hypothetical protein H8D45_27170 [Bacteroidetes bacterium]|nr:hypothetical protein [Bacteroidota bacterium]
MKITKLYPPKHNNFVLDDLPFHSLTLFGAMANCYVSLFGSESFPEFISLFEIGKISSIFPALKINDKEILFLPKPYLAKQKDKKYDEYISKKKIKKIRWLSLASIKQLGISIQQNGNDYFHSVDFLKDFTLIGNEFLITKNELTPEIVEKISLLSFYKKTDTVRVNVARFGQESIPFPQAEIRFIDASNEEMKIKLFLYFLEDMDNKKWNATKDLFADEGIGGERNLCKRWF